MFIIPQMFLVIWSTYDVKLEQIWTKMREQLEYSKHKPLRKERAINKFKNKSGASIALTKNHGRSQAWQ